MITAAETMTLKKIVNRYFSVVLTTFILVVCLLQWFGGGALAEQVRFQTLSKNASLSRDHVSVWFVPSLGGSNRCYEKSNLESMIKLVSNKFGMIAADNAPMLWKSKPVEAVDNVVNLVPILVAEHNKLSKPDERMKVMVSFNLSYAAYSENDNDTSYMTYFNVVKHFSDKVNKIFPSTVDKLFLHHDDYLRVNYDNSRNQIKPNQLRPVWEALNQNKSEGRSRLKLGMTITLDMCENMKNENPSAELLKYLDLVIPVVYVKPVPFHEYSPDEEHALQIGLLRECEQRLKKLKPEVEVIPLVICNAPNSGSFLAVSRFFQCWQLMADWAQKENRKVIIYEAFNRYEQDYVGGVGWWRLKNSADKIVNETSFLERIDVDLNYTTIQGDGLTGIYFDYRVRFPHFRQLTPYMEQDVETMLEVISTRFSTIVTGRMPFLKDTKSPSHNVTWVPQLVAKRNKKMQTDQGVKPLSVMITYHRLDSNTWLPDLSSHNSLLNLETALEVAIATNELFNDTITTLVYDGIRGKNGGTAFYGLKELLESGMGNRTIENGFKLGVVLDLTQCVWYRPNLFAPLTNWVKVFIVDISRLALPLFEYEYKPHRSPPSILWKNIDDAGKCVRRFNQTFPDVEVMLAMNCTAISPENSTTLLEDFAMCVRMVSEWGKANNVEVIISQAFDIPFSSGNMNYSVADPNGGWWKLKKRFEMKITNESFEEKLGEYLRYETNTDPPPIEIISKSDGTSSTLFALWIAIALGFLFLVGLVIVQTIRVIRKEALLSQIEMSEFFDGVKESPVNYSKEIEDSNEDAYMRMKYDTKKFEIQKQQFNFADNSNAILGKGNFGIVFKLMIPKFPNEVAVKVPNAGCNKQTLKSLLSEIKIMSYVGDNENVIRFLGAYTKEIQKGIVYVVTELCGMGSLQSNLIQLGKNSQDDKPSKLKELLRFCREVATGMKFIGGRSVIHGDLSTRNVLLDENANCKISGFGLSRKLYQYDVYTKSQPEALPWRWLAIETLKRMQFSTKSDVWAYGVTMWEIFSLGDLPYPGQVWDWDFVDKLEGGLRMKKPELASDDMYKIMLDCWNNESNNRPTFDGLEKFFQGMNESEYTQL